MLRRNATPAERRANAEKVTRAMLRRKFRVESVAFIQRYEDEFAAIVCAPEVPSQYESAMEFLTRPGCPLRVVRERVGREDIRIYVDFEKAVA